MVDGDPVQLLDQLYRESADELLIAAYALTGDASEAQEAVQEAFVRACANPAKVAKLDNPEAWLRTVALNVARDRHRRRRRLGALLRRFRPADVPAASADRVDLLDAIRKLPPGQRESIALHYLSDMAVDEIASTLKTPVNTVKSWLSRGRKALAGMLGEEPEMLGRRTR